VRRSILGAIALVLVAVSPAIADTRSVVVGGSVTGKPQIDLQGFYPKNAVIHVGDTVHFDFAGFHTVAVLPNGAVPNGPVVPTGGTNPVTLDGAGVPFWWSGINPPPELGFNPLVAMPSASNAFDGTAQVNSGQPTGFPFSYDVTFSAPGTFQIVCELHPFMKGTVTVAPADAVIPSQAAQDRAAAHQIKKATWHAVALDRALSNHGRHDGHRGREGHHGHSAQVIAGDGRKSFSLLAFYPQTITVRAGHTVTWTWRGWNEIHTVTVAPEDVIAPIESTLFGPPPTFVANPVGVLPTEPPGAPVVHTATVHGNGLLGAGVVSDNPGGPPNTFTAEFDTPGTYAYDCIIHQGMSGVIVVLPASSGHHHHH
jgi:plastocyanin